MSTLLTQVLILAAIAFALGMFVGIIWPGWRERRRNHDQAVDRAGT